MVRHEYLQGGLRIAVGHDNVVGYFISVCDRRLEVIAETDAELDDICYGVSPDGSGCYLQAYTGNYGYGRRISPRAMERLWRRYGVQESDLALLRENRPHLPADQVNWDA